MKQKKGKVGFNYLFVGCVVCLVVKLYMKDNSTYMKALYLLVIAFILGQLHVTLAKRRLGIELKTTKLGNINKKEGTKFILSLTNYSFLQSPYIHIFLKPTYHAISKEFMQLCIVLPPYGHKEIEIDYEGKYAGCEQIEIDKIILQDFFQIARRKLNKSLKASVTVLPEIKKLSNLEHLFKNMQSKLEDNEVVSAVTQEGEISSELKPYVQGDSLKLVHWKLVARRDIYMMRQREEQIGIKQDCVIVLDPICKESDASTRAQLIDKTLMACISCIHEFLHEEKNVCLVYFKENTWEHIELMNLSQLELAAQIIGNSIGRTDEKLNEMDRWPKEYLRKIHKQKVSKLLITPSITTHLVGQIEDEKGLNVLEMIQSFLGEELYGYSWHLSEQYEVVRYV